MGQRLLTLQSNEESEIRIQTSLSLTSTNIELGFEVEVGSHELILPQENLAPQFTLGLWESTCFELFLYYDLFYYEWNFSTSGDWAAFQFSDYRQKVGDLVESAPTIRWNRADQILSFWAKATLPPSTIGRKPSRFAPTCIIFDEKKPYYFAPKHSSSQPDFHLKENMEMW